jgi:UDP-N-acetyl-D-galactosamine dehydrogenase
MNVIDQLIQKKARLCVIGLGYVGLPLTLEFAKKIQVTGFDINPDKIKSLRKDIADQKISLVSDPDCLQEAIFFLVAVPTSIDKHNIPDLGPLLSACELVGKHLKVGAYVVFESTVYPGCTEEDCLPVLEKFSGLKAGRDFKYGFSPERINPGDLNHRLINTVKVVSGCDQEALENIARLYELVVEAGLYRASSIKIAEASKIVENTQRDLNIGLMNELSMIFDRMGINTYEVLDAAATKWNFLNFKPGLVGGHCISVDPFYLTFRASSLGYESKVISASRYINDEMAKYVARKIIHHVLKFQDPVVLIKGVTFKENVSDIRNSKIVDTVKELQSFHIKVDIEDPYADGEEVRLQYGIQLNDYPGKHYDAVIITVPHSSYVDLNDDYFCSITKPEALIADLKGIYRNKILNRKYWTL